MDGSLTTEARTRFVVGQNRLQYFCIHARRLLGYADATEADFEAWLKSKALFIASVDERGEVEGSFGGHEAVLSELCLCRTVDSYLVYLQDLVGLVLEHHPASIGLLRGIRGDLIADSSSVGDLHRRLAAHGRENLRGFNELTRFFDKLGLDDCVPTRGRECRRRVKTVRIPPVENWTVLSGIR
jgi:hypothetical protein